MIAIAAIATMSLGMITVRELPQKPTSFGAPVSSTGAPGEHTCATANCHDTYTPNDGHGMMSISAEGAEGGFEAGKTYNITVRVTDNTSRRFGFQVVALNDDDKSNAGTMVITDPERTQIAMNDIEFQDRQYATYTYAGTEQFADGVGLWTVKWTAPATAKNITLYAATVIANDDNTDYGDHVLTSSLALSPKSPSGIMEHQGQNAWFATPTLTTGRNLICAFALDTPAEISLELCDITGRVFPLGARHFGMGNSTVEYGLAGFATGIYVVRASSSAGSISHTIFLQ